MVQKDKKRSHGKQRAEKGGDLGFAVFPFFEYLLGSSWHWAGMKMIDTAPVLASQRDIASLHPTTPSTTLCIL